MSITLNSNNQFVITLSNEQVITTMAVAVNLLDAYPVGSIYASAVNTSPASTLGGTWSALGVHYIPKDITNPVRAGATDNTWVSGQNSSMRFVSSVDGSSYSGRKNLSLDANYLVSDNTTVAGITSYPTPINLKADLQNNTAVYLWQRVA